MAVILLIDQMSRMIHRKSIKAYENDHITLTLSKQMIENGEWDKAKFMDKQFMLLPLEHSEEKENVEKCIRKSTQLIYICRDGREIR